MNNKSRLLSVVMCLCALFVTPSFALDLTLADAVEKIAHESHDLKKANANVKKAEASLDAANANRWFQLEGTASYMNLVNVERCQSVFESEIYD